MQAAAKYLLAVHLIASKTGLPYSVLMLQYRKAFLYFVVLTSFRHPDLFYGTSCKSLNVLLRNETPKICLSGFLNMGPLSVSQSVSRSIDQSIDQSIFVICLPIYR